MKKMQVFEYVQAAMREVIAHENWIIEGSAGVAVAAFLKDAQKWRGKNIAFETPRAIFASRI